MLNSDQFDPSASDSALQLPRLPAPTSEADSRTQLSSNEPASIGKGLVVRGEISGSDSLVIEGRAEGNIHLDGNRVTVGRNGQASANISAREVVVMGKVRGNITATDRVDIRAEGAVIGDLSAPRISIEDGAFFKGAIDIRKSSATKASGLAKVEPIVVNS